MSKEFSYFLIVLVALSFVPFPIIQPADAVPLSYETDDIDLDWNHYTVLGIADTDKDGEADQPFVAESYTTTSAILHSRHCSEESDWWCTRAVQTIPNTSTLIYQSVTDGSEIGFPTQSAATFYGNWINMESGGTWTTITDTNPAGGTIIRESGATFRYEDGSYGLWSERGSSASANSHSVVSRNTTAGVFTEMCHNSGSYSNGGQWVSNNAFGCGGTNTQAVVTKGSGEVVSKPSSISVITRGGLDNFYIFGALTNSGTANPYITDNDYGVIANSVNMWSNGMEISAHDSMTTKLPYYKNYFQGVNNIEEEFLTMHRVYNANGVEYPRFIYNANHRDSQSGSDMQTKRFVAYVVPGATNANEFYYTSPYKLVDTPYDVTNSTLHSMFYVGGQETTPYDLEWVVGGTNLLLVGATQDEVNRYVATTPYDISTLTFADVIDLTVQDTAPTGITVNESLNKFWITGAGLDDIFEYDYTFGTDISTATYTGNSFDYTPHVTGVVDSVWNFDGTQLMVVDNRSGVDFFIIFDTSPYDITTAVYNSSVTTYTNGSQASLRLTNMNGVDTVSIGNSVSDLYETYTFGTYNDFTTLSFQQYIDFSGMAEIPYGYTFNDDGTKMYFVDNRMDTIYEIDLQWQDVTESRLSNYARQTYLADVDPITFGTIVPGTLLPGGDFSLVDSAGVKTVQDQKGYFTLFSDRQIQPDSQNRKITPKWTNLPSVVYPLMTENIGTTEYLISIQQAGTLDYALDFRDQTKLNGQGYSWAVYQLGADRALALDLLDDECYDLYGRDIAQLDAWAYLGEICANGALAKSVIASTNLAFTFWSLPWGTSHEYDQSTTSLLTQVRNENENFEYNVKIYHNNGTLANATNVVASTFGVSLVTFNTTGIDLPARFEISDSTDKLLYYATIGFPNYFSGVSSFFAQFFVVDGFNLLYMLPIIFAAMFTRNSVALGTGMTVAFISMLAWLGVIAIDEVIIFALVFIAILGMLAYRQLRS